MNLPLSAPFTAGQREQHRTTLLSRWFNVLQRQEVLDSESSTRAVQLRSDCTRRETQVSTQHTRVLTRDLVGQKCPALPLGEALQSARDGISILPSQELVVRRLDVRQIQCAVLVPALAITFLPHRGDNIPRRDDGVGLEHAWFDPMRGTEHPDEGLLNEVVGHCRIGDTRTDDSSHDRNERGDVGPILWISQGIRGLHDSHATHTTTDRTTSTKEWRSREARGRASGAALPNWPDATTPARQRSCRESAAL